MISKKTKILFFAVVALFGAAFVVIRWLRSPSPSVIAPDLSIATCPNAFVVSGNRDKGFTAGLNEQSRARVDLVRAVAIDPIKYIPMTQLEMFHLEEDVPFLWMTPDRKEARIDERFFSNLSVVEVVGGLKNEITVGTATSELLRRMPADIIVHFLLQSEIIRTYWHLKAVLCPTVLNQTPDIYEQRFSATHTYCTSECFVKSYSFTISINKKNGAMTVR